MSKKKRKFFEKVGCGVAALGGLAMISAAVLYAGAFAFEAIVALGLVGVSAVFYGGARIFAGQQKQHVADDSLAKQALAYEQKLEMWADNKKTYDAVMNVRKTGQKDYLPEGMTADDWRKVWKTEKARKYYQDALDWRNRMDRTETYYKADEEVDPKHEDVMNPVDFGLEEDQKKAEILTIGMNIMKDLENKHGDDALSVILTPSAVKEAEKDITAVAAFAAPGVKALPKVSQREG